MICFSPVAAETLEFCGNVAGLEVLGFYMALL